MINIEKMNGTERFGSILCLGMGITMFITVNLNIAMNYMGANLRGKSDASYEFYKDNYDALVDAAKGARNKEKMRRELDLYLQSINTIRSSPSSNSDDTFPLIMMMSAGAM